MHLHGEPEEIESVHDPVRDPDDWFIKMYGDGAMIAEPKVFGRWFIDAPVRDYADLEFVCRGV